MKQINLAEWAIKHKQIVYFFIFFILLILKRFFRVYLNTSRSGSIHFLPFIPVFLILLPDTLYRAVCTVLHPPQWTDIFPADS